MSSDKVNLNPALSHKAMAEFQRTFRNSEGIGEEKTDPVVANVGFERSPSASETYEKSRDAQTLEEMRALVDAGRVKMEETPDINEQKLAEVKERIRNGDYDTPKIRIEVSRSLANVMKILDVFVD